MTYIYRQEEIYRGVDLTWGVAKKGVQSVRLMISCSCLCSRRCTLSNVRCTRDI